MTHFTVLVLSKSVEQIDELLEPYDENAEVEPYWQETDIDWALSEEQKLLPPEDKVRIFNHIYPDERQIRVFEGTRIEQQTTYNPQSKWDWWTIGGRWAGSLRLKPQKDGEPLHSGHLEVPYGGWGGVMSPEKPDTDRVDAALKGDIDIQGMRDDAEKRAQERWDKYSTLLEKHGVWLPFRVFAETFESIDEARDKYHEQPMVKAANEEEGGLRNGAFFWSLDEEFLDLSEQEYVESARLSVIPGFAFLSEEGWVAPGEMHMFGMSTDTTRSRLDYYRYVNRLIDEAPDDALLTIVDCHI